MNIKTQIYFSSSPKFCFPYLTNHISIWHFAISSKELGVKMIGTDLTQYHVVVYDVIVDFIASTERLDGTREYYNLGKKASPITFTPKTFSTFPSMTFKQLQYGNTILMLAYHQQSLPTCLPYIVNRSLARKLRRWSRSSITINFLFGTPTEISSRR